MSFIKRISWLRYAGQTGKFFNKGDYEKALICAERALELGEKAYNPEHINVNRSLYNLVVVHRARKEYEKAEEYGLRALKITEENRGLEDKAVIDDLENLLTVYEEMKREAKVQQIKDRINKIKEKHNL